MAVGISGFEKEKIEHMLHMTADNVVNTFDNPAKTSLTIPLTVENDAGQFVIVYVGLFVSDNCSLAKSAMDKLKEFFLKSR